MREIKFRAWDVKNKKMFTPLAVYHNKELEKNRVDFVVRVTKEKPIHKHLFIALNEVKLMQFTGLKDKNGKEIYEGDILDVVWKTDGGSWKTEKMVVKFRARINNCGFWPFVHFNTGEPWKVGIIGNIYENPELLKESEQNAD